LVLPVGKKLHIYAGFGFGDKILAHSLVNVEMTNVHMDAIFHVWVDVTLRTLGFQIVECCKF
jgi:hypothetical protein